MANRRWNLALLVLLLCFAYTLVQFFWSTGRLRDRVEPLRAVTDADVQDKRRIVLISQELDNPFWRSVEQGARESAESFGMDLEYAGPFRIDLDEQLELLDQAIASRADGIIIQGSGDSRSRALLAKAAGAGIPVIAVDADEPGSGRLSYVGTDNAAAGEKMARLVAEAAGGKGAVGVLVGTMEADSQRLRLEGFRRVLAEYPGMVIADVRSSEISRLQAAEETVRLLAEHPGTGFIVGFSSLDGLGAMDAAQRLGASELRIYAFDDLAETLSSIAEGKIEGTLVQEPYQMGAEAVSLLHEFYEGNPVSGQQFTPFVWSAGRKADDSSEEEGSRP